MVAFTCNICGAFNQVESFESEPASCACGSNVRVRALIHLLSTELFGVDIPLFRFPTLPAISGLGMTDKECYARLLAEKFSYTNTFYDREPRVDFHQRNATLASTCDFVLSADVFEHVAPPGRRAMNEVWNILKPNGFLVATVPCTPDDRFVEHFPDLFEYRVVSLGKSAVLVNRRRDGAVEVREDLIFHGGPGATLEMRQFSRTQLVSELLAAGFSEVEYLSANRPEIGVLFDPDVSQPLVARKSRFAMDRAAQIQLVREWLRSQQAFLDERARADRMSQQMQMAATSRWLRLGRAFALGPKFTPRD